MTENKNDNRNLSFKCKMKEVNLNRPYKRAKQKQQKSFKDAAADLKTELHDADL